LKDAVPYVNRETVFFSENEVKLVEAIAEQIIPANNWPGGMDAGLANFIDIQLHRPIPPLSRELPQGPPLAVLENTCRNKFHHTFENLSWDSQTAVLKDMEAGRLEGNIWRKEFSEYFFELLRSHCLQGYYGSPRHGGNKNFVSYKMIGLDEPQIVGENRDGI